MCVSLPTRFKTVLGARQVLIAIKMDAEIIRSVLFIFWALIVVDPEIMRIQVVIEYW